MTPVARIALIILTAWFAVSPVLPAHAAGPRDRVATMLTAIGGVLRDPAAQAADGKGTRERRVREAIFDTFHFDEMARISLGPHWQTLSPAQREEFVRVFGDFFERSYNRLILRFLGERATRYVEETVDGQLGVVKTVLESAKDERLPVTYRLAYKDERWGVVDVVLDGVSLATNYRVQFDKVLRGSSYQTLVRKMKAKAE